MLGGGVDRRVKRLCEWTSGLCGIELTVREKWDEWFQEFAADIVDCKVCLLEYTVVITTHRERVWLCPDIQLILNRLKENSLHRLKRQS